MKARDILSSQTKGFSLFELLICIGILGILLAIALPRLTSFAHQRCIFELRERLQKAHHLFLELYSKQALREGGISSEEIERIFELLVQKEGSNCYFQRSKNGLIANIEGRKLSFVITPSDFSYKPKIYCQLSNELCREFLGKTSKK